MTDFKFLRLRLKAVLCFQGQCQDCKVGGPNLWACLEVSKMPTQSEEIRLRSFKLCRNIPLLVCFFLQNGCMYVGCGESHADHSTVHSQVRELLQAFTLDAKRA